MKDYFTYDLEAYPNIFLFCGKFKNSDKVYLFELSDRLDEKEQLLQFLYWLRNLGVEMVGFNNIGYDYYLIHELMMNPYTFNYQKAHQINNLIINGQRTGFKMERIKLSDRVIPQIDLMKICHFDNKARRTSLKALQFSMRSESLEDLPFEIRDLTHEEKDKLRKYNIHDVTETEKFFIYNEHLVDVRREYITDGVLRGDVLNYSDVKIGTEYLIARLGRTKCFYGNKPRQTFRECVEFNNIILPKIYFRTDLYNSVLEWFKQQKIYIKGEDRPKLEIDLAGLHFHFGVGGVHASAENRIYRTNDTHQIIDIDVAGMYVAVAIANRFAPEHLGDSYVEAYKQIKSDRAKYAKGTSRNAALKLAGNGAYGNSNNPYSPFYDPKYTFSVTINGQLQIVQLVEIISMIPGLELIQANTDGITVYIERKYEYLFKLWCDEWERMSGLELEEVLYSRMWIRDVNNYVAETMDGKLKQKGAYWYPTKIKEYEGWWNKDFSNLASKIAVGKVMTENWPVEIAVKLVTNKFDFMLRYKATGASKLYIGEVKQLKTVRYYVSASGEAMKKVSPPKGEVGQFKRKNKITNEFFNKVMTEIGPNVWDERVHTKNKSTYQIVETSVQAGWKVKQCNVASDFNWNDVDWNFYIEETKKLIIGSK